MESDTECSSSAVTGGELEDCVIVEVEAARTEHSDEDAPLASLRRLAPGPRRTRRTSSRALQLGRGRKRDPERSLFSLFVDMFAEPAQAPCQLARVIDTVDLSADFRPTPRISDVIVVSDADVSITGKRRRRGHDAASEEPVRDLQLRSEPRETVVVPQILPTDCPICLDKFTNKRPTMSTFCGHVFCKLCLTRIMESTKICPTCRTKLKGKGFHPIFL